MSDNQLLQAYKKDVRKFRIAGIALYQSAVCSFLISLLHSYPFVGARGASKASLSLRSAVLLILQLTAGVNFSLWPVRAFDGALESNTLTTPLWFSKQPNSVQLPQKCSQVLDEPQPLSLHLYLPRGLPKPLLRSCKLGARALARVKPSSQLLRALVLLTVYSTSGAAFLWCYAYNKTTTSASGAPIHGVILGFCFAVNLFSRGGDILTFPELQRRRVFRLKHKLWDAAACALKVSPASLLLSLMLGVVDAISLHKIWEAGPLSLLTAGALCTFCFSMGVEIVLTVLSERLSFRPFTSLPSDADHTKILFAALQDQKDPMFHAAALLELCTIAESSGKAGSLRASIFEDDTGIKWQIPAQACIDEISRLTTVIADCLPQLAPPASSPSSAVHTPQWNRRPTSMKVASVSPGRHMDVAAWQIQNHFTRAAWAVRSLTGFAAASLKEDQYGVLQLTEPGLGSAVQAMLSLLMALRHHLRLAASSGRKRAWQDQTDEITGDAQGLEDVVAISLSHLADMFGADLLPTLMMSKSKPAFGSSGELLALLKECYSNYTGGSAALPAAA